MPVAQQAQGPQCGEEAAAEVVLDDAGVLVRPGGRDGVGVLVVVGGVVVDVGAGCAAVAEPQPQGVRVNGEVGVGEGEDLAVRQVAQVLASPTARRAGGDGVVREPLSFDRAGGGAAVAVDGPFMLGVHVDVVVAVDVDAHGGHRFGVDGGDGDGAAGGVHHLVAGAELAVRGPASGRGHGGVVGD